jgi:large subunit ribosomal protein L28
MAQCAICGKTQSTGFKVSHSKRHTKRTWKPNIQKVSLDVNGSKMKVPVCTKCMRTLKKKGLI